MKRTINSDAYFSFSMRPAKLATKKEPTKGEDDIKLFDFGATEIKESFLNNKDLDDPLDSHKLYLNIVYHDRVLPPINKNKEIAN